jgi:hypothetical protein
MVVYGQSESGRKEVARRSKTVSMDVNSRKIENGSVATDLKSIFFWDMTPSYPRRRYSSKPPL